MKEKEIEVFEKVSAQIQATYDEISLLSKKSPNDALNKFKLKFVNKVISEANSLLGQKYKPFPDFEIFPEVEIPQNADAVLILAQYMACLEKLRADNVVQDRFIGWHWKDTQIRTSVPQKIKGN